MHQPIQDDAVMLRALWGSRATLVAKGGNLATIANPDGSIRWVYPADLQHPRFLRFYNADTLKARLLKMAVKTAFAVGQSKRVANGYIALDANEQNSPIHTLLQTLQPTSYTIFTGTVGENRKAVIELGAGSKTTHFVKLPIGNHAATIISNEAAALSALPILQLKHWRVPNANTLLHNTALMLTNISPEQPHTSYVLLPQHTAALQEMHQKTHYTTDWATSHLRTMTLNSLAQCTMLLSAQPLYALREALTSTLLHLDHTLNTLECSCAHGDFTPWNMFVTPTQIAVYDWELSTTHTPQYYDALHFLAQTAILVQRLSPTTLAQNMQTFLTQTYGCTPQHAHLQIQLYALYTAAYYLPLYAQQTHPHPQINWLTAAWIKLLS